MTPRIRVTGLEKSFGAVKAIDGVSFDVAPGELIALLGPSGCGKTTTLRCIGGYDTPSAGDIEIAGRRVNDLPLHRRDIGMVFQSYALFPHKTVEDNVGFALKMKGVTRPARRQQVGEALELVGMSGFGARYPAQLSGGQRQRIALARAIIHRPAVLLLDEPLANLDRKLRETMRHEIRRVQNAVSISTILVTHDQEEALVMADRVAVMDGGRIHQLASPSDVYNRPATPFVARFIGATNFFEGRVTMIENGRATVQLERGPSIIVEASDNTVTGRNVGISIRPERIGIAMVTPPDAQNVSSVRVEAVSYLGATVVYTVTVPDGPAMQVMSALVGNEPPFKEGANVVVWWSPDRSTLIV